MVTVMRPMSTGELLDRTFFLYRKHFTLFVGIVAIPYLVTLAMQLGQISLRSSGFVISSAIWSLVGALAFLVVLAASQAATIVAVSKVHLDQPASIGTSFSAIKSRLLAFVGIMIGTWLAVGIGFVFLIIPGIILALGWALIIPVAVIEKTGLRQSAKRSWFLTKGNRGRIFVVMFLFAVLIYMMVFLVQIPILAILGMLRSASPHMVPAWFLIASAIATFIAETLVAPFFTIALSLIYYDERVRKEGFDLQFMMSALQQGPEAASAAPAS